MILAELTLMLTIFFGYVAVLATFYAIVRTLESRKALEKTREKYFMDVAKNRLGGQGSLLKLLEEVENNHPRMLFSPDYAFRPIGISLIYCLFPLLAFISHDVFGFFFPSLTPIYLVNEICVLAFYLAFFYSLARTVFAYQYHEMYHKLGKRFVNGDSINEFSDIQFYLAPHDEDEGDDVSDSSPA